MNHVTCRNYSSNHFIGFDIPSLSVRSLTIIYINHETQKNKKETLRFIVTTKLSYYGQNQVGNGLGG